MDFKSGIKTDRLFWLGRYIERVYTTLSFFEKSYDRMIDEGADYENFCKSFDIPNIYKDSDDFLREYPFGEDNPDSLLNNMRRAYDNAIELREEIGSESLAYVQLAVYALNRAGDTGAPVMEFQKIIDNILAFWGCIDDMIEDENTRNLIKVGKRVERIDLYGRLKKSRVDIGREVRRLAGRIDRCQIHYSENVIWNLKRYVEEDSLDYGKIVKEIDQILDV